MNDRELDPARTALFLKTITRINRVGLMALVDLHPEPEEKARMREEPAVFEFYVQFWEALAPHLKRVSPENLTLELLSEPSLGQTERWWALQGKMVERVRAKLPKHTLIVGADGWNRHDLLAKSSPYPDKNLVYNFHYYSPYVFTHQGASWDRPELLTYQNLEYPTRAENVRQVISNSSGSAANAMLRDYLANPWNQETMQKDLQPVVVWASKFGAKVTVNEFGAFGKLTDRKSKHAWVRDARECFEKVGFRWTLWDYSSHFGITHESDRVRNIDPGMLRALGMPNSRYLKSN